MAISRNARCPCNSGKKYKDCCGTLDDRSLPLRSQALEAHRAGHLDVAEPLYRAALAAVPGDVDVLHMLGVVLLQKLRYIDALEHLWAAAEGTSWNNPEIRYNIGMVVAQLQARSAYPIHCRVFEAFRSWDSQTKATSAFSNPLVSVILPTYNDECYVGQSIASVSAQTYANIELIVIDDGSQDGTERQVRECLASVAMPASLISREHEGAPATLNEGAALARGAYVAFLNSGDLFGPDRIARMVAEVAMRGIPWGFSLVATKREDDNPLLDAGGIPDVTPEMQLVRLRRVSNSFAFMSGNVALSSANLFVERAFFRQLQGFRNFRHHYGWDFCLRASGAAEPNVIEDPLYIRFLHGVNADKDAQRGAEDEIEQMLATLFSDAAMAQCTNALAPQWPDSRTLAITEALRHKMGLSVPLEVLRDISEQTRAAFPFLRTGSEVRSSDRAGPCLAPVADATGLERWERPTRPATSLEAGLVSPRDKSAPEAPTAGFVLCIENNAIREQAVLLCESIRRFAGRFRDSRILAVAPRPGLGVDANTIATLADMGVEYIEEAINTVCPEYGSANRVFSAAWAERHANVDFLVVLDSDTVFLDEPALPLNADVAVRPEDTKGSGTTGPDDVFEPYWRALADLSGVSLDRLPFIETSVDKVRMRASYNGGLVVARRESKLLTRWADCFARSVRSDLRPHRATGHYVIASTGFVGKTASEFWGSNQAVLALAILANACRVVHYPMSYNIPLHLLADHPQLLSDWTSDGPPVHVHYHWLFNAGLDRFALDLLDKLGVSQDRLTWLSRRVPLNS